MKIHVNICLKAVPGVESITLPSDGITTTQDPITAATTSPSTPVTNPCDRSCTGEAKTCEFTFTATAQMSTNDMADGRIREVLTYNNQIPGPLLKVCEGDTVHVNLINKIEAH